MNDKFTKAMIIWLQTEYPAKFDLNILEPAIKVMLTNYKREVIKDYERKHKKN